MDRLTLYMKSRAVSLQAAWPFFSAESRRPCNPFRRVALAKINFPYPYIKKNKLSSFFLYLVKVA
jgi:hypothetical protein